MPRDPDDRDGRTIAAVDERALHVTNGDAAVFDIARAARVTSRVDPRATMPHWSSHAILL